MVNARLNACKNHPAIVADGFFCDATEIDCEAFY
uniref:Uncharacterized protein n=1 Tax=Anguilla anguilla TaxID=7936 RepID=A0A0E9PZT0_ANGAN